MRRTIALAVLGVGGIPLGLTAVDSGGTPVAAAEVRPVVQACNPHFSWCPSAGYETPHACVVAKNQMEKLYWVQPDWDGCLQAQDDFYFRYSGPR
ncbi:hypothetical protein [Kribbella sp. NPDC051770]|uniref:hypothetical protein n=1 Tax=Kribbella sp. NPDC051770 TaxID=3155413 RepID=UPI0034326079